MVDRQRNRTRDDARDSRITRAKERGERFARRVSELHAQQPITQDGVDLANQRARSALVHSAAGHERAATLHYWLSDRGGPYTVAHHDAAVAHREASDQDILNAFDV